jgi:hypothetical protein
MRPHSVQVAFSVVPLTAVGIAVVFGVVNCRSSTRPIAVI